RRLLLARRLGQLFGEPFLLGAQPFEPLHRAPPRGVGGHQSVHRLLRRSARALAGPDGLRLLPNDSQIDHASHPIGSHPAPRPQFRQNWGLRAPRGRSSAKTGGSGPAPPRPTAAVPPKLQPAPPPRAHFWRNCDGVGDGVGDAVVDGRGVLSTGYPQEEAARLLDTDLPRTVSGMPIKPYRPAPLGWQVFRGSEAVAH